MLLFIDMDAEVGKDFDAGLSNLKVIVEKMPSPEKSEEKDVETKEQMSDS